MLASQKQSIEDLLVETLAEHPYIEGPALISHLQAIRPHTTKQAVYTALKFLLQNEVVAKVGATYFLSRFWLSRIHTLFQDTAEKGLSKDAIFNLSDGESISYHFPSFLTCDTYWAHIFNLLIEWTPAHRPICVWNPHELFVIGRTEVEKEIFAAYTRHNKHTFHTIGGTTPLDYLFKKEWGNNVVSINIGSSFPFPTTYYLDVFDHFIIEVFLTPSFAKAIEQFYAEHTTLAKENVLFFEKLLAQKSPVRMKISHKKKRASLLRTQLLKDFFVPTELREQST